jgi:uncharacterized protein YggU (UPF0235/DUF167 family)
MYIKVRVKAGAKKELVKKVQKDLFHLEVKEEAKNNKANNRIRQLLALYFKLPLGALRIISGHHSPSKIISVTFPDGR